MKTLFLSVVLVMVSTIVRAQDVSKILDDNQCTPVRQNDGRISAFECAGALGQVAEVAVDEVADSLSDSTQPLSLE
jgi:hypothetical protein